MFCLAYNTNGLAHHRPHEALELLADLGYGGVAITPDVGALDPLDPEPEEVRRVARVARERGLRLSVETGGRFLLDPRRKHRPNLLEEASEERARRIDLLQRHIDLAAELGAEVVSFWAGQAPGGIVGDPERADAGEAEEAVWERLCAGAQRVLAHGKHRGVRVAFEPEPGMFVERPSGYRELLARLGTTSSELGLCLDVGHLLCTGDLPVEDVVCRLGPDLVTVHLDDIRHGEHVHRMFGEGDLDLAATLEALRECGFEGIASVELSRDAHRGFEAAREAMKHLKRALESRASGA